MSQKVTLKDNPIDLYGDLPEIGSTMVSYELVKTDLTHLSLSNLKGKRILYNIFPSVDTPVCATSMKTFHTRVAQVSNTVLVCVSADLPFAQGRFCGTEGLDQAINASCFRDEGAFGKATGLLMTSGPLKGLLARAVIVTDENGIITHTELVSEITQEPNYEKAIAALA